MASVTSWVGPTKEAGLGAGRVSPQSQMKVLGVQRGFGG